MSSNNVAQNTMVEVTISDGRIKGKEDKDYKGGVFYKFLGIPYARAPLGELRFRAPEPPVPWTGVKNATKPGAECPQFFGIYTGKIDNCLNLNVYTKKVPRSSQSFRKPVMVFIHGGGFVSGSNHPAMMYGPHYLMVEDIVLVAVNYRLGILGFLALEDRSLNVPGNAGMKDQVMALKWVQKNIVKFGGDPGNVTIFGESAGGASVHYHVLSPMSKGLFQKAIIQSGCVLNPWAKTRPNAKEIIKYMGYKQMSEKKLLEKLNGTSIKSLVKCQMKFQGNFEPIILRPVAVVVEYPNRDAFLTEEPLEILRSGRQNDVTLMMGYNSLEGLFFELLSRSGKKMKIPTSCETDVPNNSDVDTENEKLVKQVAKEIKQFYYKDEDIRKASNRIRYLIATDTQFVYGILKSLQLHKKTGKSPVYAYRMNIQGRLNICRKFALAKSPKTMSCCMALAMLTGSSCAINRVENMAVADIDGVAHADDLFYLFRSKMSVAIKEGSEEDKWVKRFVKLWTNFAKTGSPTSGDSSEDVLRGVEWKPIGSTDLDNVFNIDIKLGCTPLHPDERRRMLFWDKYHTKFGI